MKRLSQIVLLATLLFGGCIKDDCRKSQKKPNVLLKFRYEEAGIDVFEKTISGVHLFVFNQEDGQFVLSKQLDQSLLTKLQGAELYLPKGTYQIVCWGNADQNSKFCFLNKNSHFNDRTETYIFTAKTDANSGYAKNGDKLYYAPYCESKTFIVTVSALQETNYTLDFKTAHATIDVYITGFSDPSDQADNELISIELTHLTPKYDFELNEFEEPITYRQTALGQISKETDTEIIAFNTPLVKRDNDIQVVLRKQPTNQLLETIHLKEFIDAHYSHIDLSSTQPVNLKIEFKHTNGKITVSIPTWNENVVHPEI